MVTGYTGAEIKQILTYMMESEAERAKGPLDAVKKMGGDAPAFGMLGTLIGLVIMLGSMGGDPAAIGPSMAVALITTFYGIILARIVMIPIGAKISARFDKTTFKENLKWKALSSLPNARAPVISKIR